LPQPIVKTSAGASQLVSLLKPFAAKMPGVFLYHPGRHQVLPKLRAFIEHVRYRGK
jgi:hypothetical protein